EVRDGRESPGAADLHADRFDAGRRLLRGVLERDRPAWGLARRSGLLLQLQIVQLEDDAVGLELLALAARLPLVAVGEGLLDPVTAPRLGQAREAGRLQPGEHLRVRRGAEPARGSDAVRREAEPARRDDLGIDHAQSPGRGVARVREDGLLGL